MNQRMLLVELMLAGFFAVACIRTLAPADPESKLHFRDLLRLPNRLERLHRTRWQWFSMVGLLLVIRLQEGVPLILEATVAMQFVVFLALPSRPGAVQTAVRR